MVPSSPQVPWTMGKATSIPEASRWRSVGATGTPTGGISFVPPAITASDAAASIQQPSAAMPSGATSCLAARSPWITVRAERIETWCSTLRPPKTTPTWAMKGSPVVASPGGTWGSLQQHPPRRLHLRQSAELLHQRRRGHLVHAQDGQRLVTAAGEVDVGDVDVVLREEGAHLAHHAGAVQVLQ